MGKVMALALLLTTATTCPVASPAPEPMSLTGRTRLVERQSVNQIQLTVTPGPLPGQIHIGFGPSILVSPPATERTVVRFGWGEQGLAECVLDVGQDRCDVAQWGVMPSRVWFGVGE